MVLLDDQRRHVEVNGAYLALVGRPRRELIGRPVYGLFAHGPLASPREWEAALAQKQFTGRAEIVCAGGEHVLVEFAGHPETVTGRRLVLFVALRTARAGRSLPPSAPPRADARALSGRELDVIRLLARGLTGPEVAAELQLAHNTVRTHVRNAMAKFRRALARPARGPGTGRRRVVARAAVNSRSCARAHLTPGRNRLIRSGRCPPRDPCAPLAAMSTGTVADDARQLLRRLAANDEICLARVLAPGLPSEPTRPGSHPLLDARTSLLVRLAALLTLDACTESVRWAVDLAFAAGADDEALAAVLIVSGATGGAAQLAASASRLALALGIEPGEQLPATARAAQRRRRGQRPRSATRRRASDTRRAPGS